MSISLLPFLSLLILHCLHFATLIKLSRDATCQMLEHVPKATDIAKYSESGEGRKLLVRWSKRRRVILELPTM
jgi:hypothetical protein